MTPTDWLQSGGSYREGVALLETAGLSVVTERRVLTRRLIRSAEKQALRERIEKLCAQTGTTVAGLSQTTPQQHEPSSITEYRRRGRAKMKLYSDAKTRLNMMAEDPDKYTDSDRYEVAEYLMEELQPEIDHIYGIIRAYEGKGEVPAMPADDVVAETVKKMKRVLALRPHLSRARKELTTATPAEKKAIEERIEHMEEELAQLSTELGL